MNSKLRMRVASIALSGALVGGGLAIAPAVVPELPTTSASAHTGTLETSFTCLSDGTYEVLYKGETKSVPATGAGHTAKLTVGEIQPVGTTVTPATQTVTGNAKYSWKQIVPGTAKYAQSTAFLVWGDGAKSDPIGKITLKGDCKAEGPKPVVTLDGSATCEINGTYTAKWKVTITNYGALNEVDLKVIKHAPAGSLINGVDAQVWLNEWKEHYANHKLPPFPEGGVATFTQTNIPGTATSAMTGVQYDFKGGPSGDPEKTITLEGDCKAADPATGTVVVKGTYCDGPTSVGNNVVVTLEKGTTAERFVLDADGKTWISKGDVPAGTYGDSFIGSSGYPNTQKFVLTGKDGSQLTFGPYNFEAPRTDCEKVKTDVLIDYRGTCRYDADQDLSFKEVWLTFDNRDSNVAQSFTVAAPYGDLTRVVPAGERIEVRAQDGWEKGVEYRVTAGGKVFELTLPAFESCKPIVATAEVTLSGDVTCFATKTVEQKLSNAELFSVDGKEGAKLSDKPGTYELVYKAVGKALFGDGSVLKAVTVVIPALLTTGCDSLATTGVDPFGWILLSVGLIFAGLLLLDPKHRILNRIRSAFGGRKAAHRLA